MRKHGMLLTMIAAVLLIALCIGALELAKILLPDHQDVIEEIDISENQSVLTVKDRGSDPVYPWDIYKSAKENSKLQSVEPIEPEFDSFDKYISQVVEILSPWVSGGYENIAWSEKAEYVEDGVNSILFIKDVSFDNAGENYLVNIALSDDRIIYYACDRFTADAPSSELIASSYDKLNNDYMVFRGLYRSGSYYIDYQVDDGEVDARESVSYDTLMRSMDDNCFEEFLQSLRHLIYSETEWNEFDPDFVDYDTEYADLTAWMIGDSDVNGMVYKHSDQTPNVVNVELSQAEGELILFYDLGQSVITGFSMKI